MQKIFFVLCFLSLFWGREAAAQTASINLTAFLESLYSRAALLDEARQYKGALCTSNPMVGYARSKGFLTLSSCPGTTAKATLAQIYEASYKVYLYRTNQASKMLAYRLAYDGVDITGINKPYGVLADPFKFVYMINGLARMSSLVDPYSSTYGLIRASSSEAEGIVNKIFGESWLEVFSAIEGSWWQPSKGLTWEIQLQGDVGTDIQGEAIDIDLFDSPRSRIDSMHTRGQMVICYFSAGSYENWRPDAKSFPSSVKGYSNGWPGENWLDIRNQSVLGPIMQARLDVAIIKGCDAVDPDNVDGYTNRSGFPLTYSDQLAYNMFLADQAHARGLAIGLKNDLNQIPDLVDDFDFSINESCYDYDECHLLDPFIEANKPVLGIEYELPMEAFCADANAKGYSFLKKDWDLMTPGQACWE